MLNDPTLKIFLFSPIFIKFFLYSLEETKCKQAVFEIIFLTVLSIDPEVTSPPLKMDEFSKNYYI